MRTEKGNLFIEAMADVRSIDQFGIPDTGVRVIRFLASYLLRDRAFDDALHTMQMLISQRYSIDLIVTAMDIGNIQRPDTVSKLRALAAHPNFRIVQNVNTLDPEIFGNCSVVHLYSGEHSMDVSVADMLGKPSIAMPNPNVVGNDLEGRN